MAISKMNNKQVVKVKNSDVKEIDFRKLNNAGENFLTESGIYKLVFKSHKPNAEEFTDWIADKVLPSIRKTGSYTMPKDNADEKVKRADAMLLNAKTRAANLYLKMAEISTESSQYKNILVAKAAQTLSGEELLPLQKQDRKTYSAKEIGDLFGISAQRVGKIANANNLKISEYGEMYRSKSEYSTKEVDTWRYYDSAIEAFSKLLGAEVA